MILDGECGFCRASAAWLAERDPHRQLRFATDRGAAASTLFGRRPGHAGRERMVLWFPAADARAERVVAGADAIIVLLRLVGRGGWSRWLRAAPRWLREAGYEWIARIRRRLPARACRIDALMGRRLP